MLTYRVDIPGFYTMTQKIQNGFRVTPEGDSLILNKNIMVIVFDEKMENTGGNWFILKDRLYKIMRNFPFIGSNI